MVVLSDALGLICIL